MDKKEEFKNFARNNPGLKNHVENGSMTWQKFYEMYDIYGNDQNTWQKYKANNIPKQEDRFFNPNTITNLTGLVKKVNMTSVQKHINTAQKAINLFKEFGTKGSSSATNTLSSISKGPLRPRPLNKFFED